MAASYVHGFQQRPAPRRDYRRQSSQDRGSLRRPRRARRALAGLPRHLPAALERDHPLRARPHRSGREPGRSRRHLVAQSLRVGDRPVRDGAHRRDPRQREPRLQDRGARVRAEAVGGERAPPRASVPSERLREDARRGAGRLPRIASNASCSTTTGTDCSRAAGPSRARRSKSGNAPCNSTTRSTSSTRPARPASPREPRSRTTTSSTTASSSARRSGSPRRTGSASRCRSITASAWSSATSRARRTARPWSIPGEAFDRSARARGGRGGAVHGALRRPHDVHRRARAAATSRSSISPRSGPASWPARPARSRS